MLEAEIRAVGLANAFASAFTSVDGFESLFPSEVLADCDELHLRRHDASARVRELRHCAAVRGFAGRPLQARKRLQPDAALAFLGVLEAEIAVVFRTDLASLVFDGVRPIEDPLLAERRQAVA